MYTNPLSSISSQFSTISSDEIDMAFDGNAKILNFCSMHKRDFSPFTVRTFRASNLIDTIYLDKSKLLAASRFFKNEIKENHNNLDVELQNDEYKTLNAILNWCQSKTLPLEHEVDLQHLFTLADSWEMDELKKEMQEKLTINSRNRFSLMQLVANAPFELPILKQRLLQHCLDYMGKNKSLTDRELTFFYRYIPNLEKVKLSYSARNSTSIHYEEILKLLQNAKHIEIEPIPFLGYSYIGKTLVETIKNYPLLETLKLILTTEIVKCFDKWPAEKKLKKLSLDFKSYLNFADAILSIEKMSHYAEELSCKMNLNNPFRNGNKRDPLQCLSLIQRVAFTKVTYHHADPITNECLDACFAQFTNNKELRKFTLVAPEKISQEMQEKIDIFNKEGETPRLKVKYL